MVITKQTRSVNIYPRYCDWFGVFLFVVVVGMTQAADAMVAAKFSVGTERGLFYLYESGEKKAQLADMATDILSDKRVDTLNSKHVRLEPLGHTRYQLPIVYVYVEGQLYQKKMIAQGQAFTMTDQSHTHTRMLLGGEGENHPSIDVDGARKYMNRYAKVCGKVHEVAEQRTATYINFGEDWKSDFTIYIPKSVARKMDQEMLIGLSEKRVCVRGFIHPYYGPRITVLNPDMLEIERNEHTE